MDDNDSETRCIPVDNPEVFEFKESNADTTFRSSIAYFWMPLALTLPNDLFSPVRLLDKFLIDCTAFSVLLVICISRVSMVLSALETPPFNQKNKGQTRLLILPALIIIAVIQFKIRLHKLQGHK
nr:MAG TPA: hypothetical protein [Bacteriophage sp.]